ncbi:ABC transporter substrate-binding protein [Paracidovorax citrulli]|uniref:Amino acid ABC transporter substrate-binding protein, PAAT family n=2 Tax=Paracidovorax citrulli TaxID=80869 RepID=A1TIX0_PARC0|nr:ABC transporter substrate-binding protein [Paracidovorax citrulli]ABM30908.1 amino acid ABC transporter substrate-binding protein, PAAT family [Paracidovorax citrulli AAC00-1]ATG95924.1 amino acid ABC transporter substrate-binding protein [Paracidovorax citrulli]MVT37856.1 transporter substrate-binding domain-containing protein [Paracidovorax citrulli]PVY65085.1 amino acid ABC transporter substrate-binding protein (PAAT family) [Paracidovorax citrulli]REG70725.1 amino acid ABC transporter s
MKILKTMATAAVALCAAFSAQARPIDAIQKDGKIIIATEGQFAPFNYFNGTQLTGFEVEVANLVAKKMNLKVEWKTLGFDALLTGLGQDRWDVAIASHGVTEERSKAVTFAAPHYCSGGMVIAMDPAIRTGKDLAGKVVAVQTGTSYLENVKKVPGVKDVKNFPTDVDARSALTSKRVDAWVTDKFVAKEVAAKNPKAGLKLGDMLFIEKMAPAVAKGNTGLADAWNKAFAEILADGSYAAVSKKYFNEDVRCAP